MRIPASFTNPWTGEQWSIRRVPNLKHNNEPADGVCDHEHRELRIDTKQADRELLITLLHEVWHAKGTRNFPHLVRRRLNTICADMADAIIALGILKK